MTQLDHRRIDELLPWLVNGTLEGEERERVEHHVGGCVACRRQMAELTLLSEVVSEERPEDAAAERALGELRGHLAAELPAPRTKRRGGLWLAAAIAVLTLGLGALWRLEAPPEPAFRTLSSPAAAIGTAPQLRVLFAETVSEREIRGLLHEIGGEIVAGPTPLGVFTVELAPDATAALARDQLRDHPGVRFAEVVSD